MPIDYSILAQPKPEPRKKTKARKDRQDAKALQEFRDLVWRREQERFLVRLGGWTAFIGSMALCEHCGALVYRNDERPLTGEVHHRIGRRNKATRYDPANGVLLCNHLVNNCHARAQRGLIEV